MTVSVLPYGTLVEIGPQSEPIEGEIHQQCLKGAEYVVQYEVVWWIGRERKSEWLNASEVRTKATKSVKIGFIE